MNRQMGDGECVYELMDEWMNGKVNDGEGGWINRCVEDG